MSAFVLPKSCITKLTSLCNNFLWGGDDNKSAHVKVAWNSVCLPKSEGGLGLRDLSIWNKTLRLKLIWRLFVAKDSLWVAWCKENKLKNRNFWTLKEKPTDSWVWGSILRMRQLATRYLHSSVHNGKATSFWWDVWLPEGKLIDLVAGPGSQLLGIPINATVAEASRVWNKNLARVRRPGLLPIYRMIQNAKQPDPQKGEDKWSWHESFDQWKVFNTNYTWNSLRPRSDKVWWKKAVWFSGGIPKFSFHMWTATLDRLPVRERLSRWNSNISPLCVICCSHFETRDHVLLHCDFAEQVWSLVLHRLDTRPALFHVWSTLLVWISSSSPGVPAILKKIAVQTTVYNIWMERNMRLHQNTSNTAQVVFRLVDRSVRDLILANRSNREFQNLLQVWFRYQ